MSALTRWEPVMTRWNPFKDLEDMEKRLSTYLGRPAVRTEAGKEAMTVAEWSRSSTLQMAVAVATHEITDTTG